MKKIIILTVFFLCFAGVIQASSINGVFNGDPIVKVLSEGKELVVKDAPAIIREGRTLVPIYLLEQLGAVLKWNSETYSVDLTLPDPTKELSATLQEINSKATEFDGKNVRLVHDQQGPYLLFELIKANDSNLDNDRIVGLSGFLPQTPAEMLVIHMVHNDQFMTAISIQRSDIEQFLNKKIPEYEFIQKWKYSSVKKQSELFSTNLRPEPTPAPRVETGLPFYCENVIQSYLFQSHQSVRSYNEKSDSPEEFQQYLAKLDESKNNALEAAGCPQP
jgi:hypothetical protein